MTIRRWIAVIPAAVGVDIGCGMMATRLSLEASDLPQSLRAIRRAIEQAVPVGFDRHRPENAPVATCRLLEQGYRSIAERHPDLLRRIRDPGRRWIEQMGTRSYIVRGRGKPDSLMSSAHGAGRQMSRRQARKRFSLDDLKTQTRGVECRRDKGVLDEAPGA